MLVNSIKFDQSGAAWGSRSDTHRGGNTFEKLAFSKIKRHIGMKPIVMFMVPGSPAVVTLMLAGFNVESNGFNS